MTCWAKLDTVLDLPAQYTELAEQFKEIVRMEFKKYGLELVDFYISSITPPEEVSQMIDQRSGMEAVGDLDKFLKFEMAKGLGSTHRSGRGRHGHGRRGGGDDAGMLHKVFSPEQTDLKGQKVATVTCPKCHTETPEQSRYCYRCGQQMVVQNICPRASRNFPTEANYCLYCGHKLDAKVTCPALPERSYARFEILRLVRETVNDSDSMARPKPKGGFFIGVTCPGCGGDLELQATFSS